MSAVEANDVSDVTLGEVNRNLTGLRSDVRDLTKDITELKVSNGTNADRVRRLESIVYGAVGTGVAAFITAVFSLIYASK
jgi:hypothetical protein